MVSLGMYNEVCVGLPDGTLTQTRRLDVSPVFDQLHRNDTRMTIGDYKTQLDGRMMGSYGSYRSPQSLCLDLLSVRLL
jgi:hypothetical protein